MFEIGKQFPPAGDVERLANYKRGKSFFDGKQHEVYQRASDLSYRKWKS
ncbi:hypothetical protein ACSVDA_21300 [Cytobacillus sp. Hm23]